MAGPGGREVGRVSVKVLPDTSTFARSLERYLERVERRLRVELPVSLNAADVAQTEAKLAVLSRDRTVELDVDTTAIDRIGKAFDKVGAGGGRGGFGIGFLSPGVIAAITVAIAGLIAIGPALLTSVAAPLAAVAVGFEGIKRAAENLALPFQVMQTTVSNVFEKGLTPVFQNLEKLMPTLTEGFVQMADALILIADVVVDRLTSSGGLTSIANTFTAISDALTLLAPAIGTFVDSVLLLAERGAESFERFAPLLAAVFERFGAILDFLDRTGLLSDAMDALALAIIAVVAALGAIVLIVVIVAGAFARVVKLAVGMPGRIRGALSSLGGIIAGIFQAAVTRARAIFTAGFNAVVSFLRGIPGRIRGAFGNAGAILSGIARAIVNGFRNAFGRAWDAAMRWVKGKIAGLGRAAKIILGIGSPSKVFMSIGDDVGRGFQLGIEKSMGDVGDMIQRLVDGTIPTASVALAAGVNFPPVTERTLEASLVGARVEMGQDGFGRFVDGRIVVRDRQQAQRVRFG